MIRRFGAPKQLQRRYTLRPGAYAVLVRDGSVLLTHQSEPFDEFQLPGGGIDAGESPTLALHREVMEETGWRISNLRRLGAFRRFTYMPDYDLWAEKLCHIYAAFPTRQVSEPLEDGHTAIWTSAEEASRILYNEGDRHFLRNYAL